MGLVATTEDTGQMRALWTWQREQSDTPQPLHLQESLLAEVFMAANCPPTEGSPILPINDFGGTHLREDLGPQVQM
jgi:hypothetical protein